MPKSTRSDFLVEKVTEVGASCIIPVITKRSVFIPNKREKEESDRLQRWTRLILQASKQSLCPVTPELKKNMELYELLEKELPNHDMTLWGCMPNDPQVPPQPIQQFFQTVKTPPKSVLVVIGPEGGFTSQEKQDLIDAKAIPVSISPNRLRTETAAFVILAEIMGQWNPAERANITVAEE